MTQDLNKVYIEGTINSDPIVRHPPVMNTEKTKSLVMFTIMVRNEWVPESVAKGGKRKTRRCTQSFKVVVWGKTAKRIEEERLAKGDHVLIMGELRRDSWLKSGNRVYETSIHVMGEPRGRIDLLRLQKAETPSPDCKGASEEQPDDGDLPAFSLEDMP